MTGHACGCAVIIKPSFKEGSQRLINLWPFCCFGSGEEFSWTKNEQNEVGEGLLSSSNQNKNKKLSDIPEVTSFVTNLSLRGQLHWSWPKREI